MIRSMTGFAREELHSELGSLSWELRSVNHRYLEVVLRLPEELRGLEQAIRERLTERLGRGKLECVLKYTPSHQIEVEIQIDWQLVEQLKNADAEIAGILRQNPAMSSIDLLRWPGVLHQQEQDLTPLKQQAMELLDATLDTLIDNRLREGQRLGEIVLQRKLAMDEQVNRVRILLPDVVMGIKQRIRDRLLDVLDELDEYRLEQEMALIAQRLDVDEEMDRLSTHLDEVERVLASDEPVGRRLDFLMQELNREANTLTSKSSDVEVTRIAVEMKVLIEQMREQIQNIE